MRAFLILHGVLGITTVGVLTHHAIWSLRPRKDPNLARQSRRYATLGALFAAAQVSLGAVILPMFRPHTKLFNLKIGVAAAALMLALIARVMHLRREPLATARAGVAILAAVCAWAAGLMGLYWVGGAA